MKALIPTIINQLEAELATAIAASDQAHSSATHSENKAANRYDTLALEAAYLAHGQSMRVAALKDAIVGYKKFIRPVFTNASAITLGAVVELAAADDSRQLLFLGPGAGGMKLLVDDQLVQILTMKTPLCKALLGKSCDDEIQLTVNSKVQYFTVVNIL